MSKTRIPSQQLQVLMLAWASLLNEVPAPMVASLIPVLLATELAAGPVAIVLAGGAAEAVAAFVKLWSGCHALRRPRRRKALVVFNYGLAPAPRQLIGLAAHRMAVAGQRTTGAFGRGNRKALRDAMMADTALRDMQGRDYVPNRGMPPVFALQRIESGDPSRLARRSAASAIAMDTAARPAFAAAVIQPDRRRAGCALERVLSRRVRGACLRARPHPWR